MALAPGSPHPHSWSEFLALGPAMTWPQPLQALDWRSDLEWGICPPCHTQQLPWDHQDRGQATNHGLDSSTPLPAPAQAADHTSHCCTQSRRPAELPRQRVGPQGVSQTPGHPGARNASCSGVNVRTTPHITRGSSDDQTEGTGCQEGPVQRCPRKRGFNSRMGGPRAAAASPGRRALLAAKLREIPQLHGQLRLGDQQVQSGEQDTSSELTPRRTVVRAQHGHLHARHH